MTPEYEPGPVIEARFAGALGTFRLDAAFTTPAKGITGLVGPSGSGKTSLLRCIAGLTPLPGRLTVKGEVWQDERRYVPAHKRAVGYVFQEPSLLAHLSVRGNLMFGFRRSGGDRKIDVSDVVSLLGIGALLERSVQRLSGGEQQRVAIGRALLSQPELLLMDEPVSSLDPESKAEILPYLERLHQTLSIPVIYVSHDLVEVARLADRVLLMRGGRILNDAGATGGMGGTSPSGRAAARGQLKHLDDDRVTRLAIAALAAGLKPVETLAGGS